MRYTALILSIIFISFSAAAQTGGWRKNFQYTEAYGHKSDSLLILPKITTDPALLEDAALRYNFGVFQGRALGSWLDFLYAKDTASISNRIYDARRIDTVKTILSMMSYSGRAKILLLTDSIRGGFFYLTANAVADSGIVFPGSGGYWKRMYDRQTIYVDWFGPHKDGVTDDLWPITKAINSGAQNVVLGIGSYAISYQVTLKSGVNLSGAGIDKTIIVALPSTATPPPIGSPDTWAVYGEGSMQQLPNLSASAKTQDTSLALASSASVAANDLILIGDTASFSYSSYRYYYRQGEYFFTTKGTSGSNVFIQGGLYGNYPTATTSIYKVTPIYGSIANLTIDSKNYTIGIGIKHGNNYTVHNVKSVNGNKGNINYYYCINSSIRDCYAAQYTDAAGPYGITISDCQNVTVERNYAYGQRHGITVGSFAQYPFVSRAINIVNNSVGDSTNNGGNGAIDVHGSVENSSVMANTVYGAISVAGGNNTISDNIIFMGNRSGRAMFLYEVREINFDIKDNIATFNGSAYDSFGSGFAYSATGGEKFGGTIRVNANKFIYNNSNTTVTNTIYVNYNNSVVNMDFVADGNYIRHAPNTLAHRGVIALGLNAANKINMVTITNNVFKYAGIRADYSKSVFISGNHVDSCNTYVVLCGNDGSVNIQNNYAENYAYNGGVSTGYFVNNASRLWFTNNSGGSNASGHLYQGQFISDTILQVGLNNIYGTTNYSITGSYTAQSNSLPAGNFGIGTGAPTSRLDVNGSNGYNQLRLRTSYTPTGNADSNGNIGDVSWDALYFYIKTSAGWKRSVLTTF